MSAIDEIREMCAGTRPNEGQLDRLRLAAILELDERLRKVEAALQPSLSNAQLLAMVPKNRPPQSWYDSEEERLFEPTGLGEEGRGARKIDQQAVEHRAILESSRKAVQAKLDGPTPTGIERFPPDGLYECCPCICTPECDSPCKGQCGCKACSVAYGDFLSAE